MASQEKPTAPATLDPPLIDRLLAPSRSKHRSMFGVKTQSSWATAFVFDHLLTVHRKEVRWIVEIGTGRGGMSLMLAMWAKVNGVPFWTIDLNDFRSHEVNGALVHLRASVIVDDVFQRQGFVSRWHNTGFLLCDGGDKPRELATFAPMVPLGTLIAVHDFGIEIKPEHVSAVPCVRYYEPWHAQSIEMNTTAAILRRV